MMGSCFVRGPLIRNKRTRALSPHSFVFVFGCLDALALKSGYALHCAMSCTLLNRCLVMESLFQGRSIFASPAEPRSVFLVQPYAGRYVEVVNHPYKYILHLRSREEMLETRTWFSHVFQAKQPTSVLQRRLSPPPALLARGRASRRGVSAADSISA